jgi:hypothetical protein
MLGEIKHRKTRPYQTKPTAKGAIPPPLPHTAPKRRSRGLPTAAPTVSTRLVRTAIFVRPIPARAADATCCQ